MGHTWHVAFQYTWLKLNVLIPLTTIAQDFDNGGFCFFFQCFKNPLRTNIGDPSKDTKISAVALIHKANQCAVCHRRLDWHDPLSAFLFLNVNTGNSV